VIDQVEWNAAGRDVTEPAVLDLAAEHADAWRPGVVSAATGLAGFPSIDEAISTARAGEVDAVGRSPPGRLPGLRPSDREFESLTPDVRAAVAPGRLVPCERRG
jgi:hypothetical protein